MAPKEDQQQYALQSQVDDHEKRLTALETDLKVKVDQLVLAFTKMQASLETALAMIKAAPIVIALLGTLIGGFIWLIKHA